MAAKGPFAAVAHFLPLLQPWALLPPSFWQRSKDIFTYTANFTGTDVAAASVTTTVNINISNDSDFLWVATRGVFADTSDVVLTVVPPFTIQFTDSANGRALLDRPGHVASVMGVAIATADVGEPNGMAPKLLAGGSTLAVALTNLAATARNVRVSLMGLKLFPFAG